MKEEASHDEIDIRELLSVLWSEKILIMAVTLFSALGSVGYALSLPNIYQSSALLSPSDESEGAINGLLGQYGGLASMAGVSLPLTGSVSKAGLALEVLKSRSFTQEFIGKHDILPELLAVDHWDAAARRLVIDKNLYDEEAEEWIRQVKAPSTKTPSAHEAFEKFKNILSVTQNAKTKLITISIMHESPEIAKQWVVWLVEGVNETMRRKEIEEAMESIQYLKRQAAETTLADLDQVFFALMEAQMQRMMLAEVRREYVLTTIDPPVIPELKSEPRRSMLVIFGTLLGAMIGALLALLRHFIIPKS